MILKTLYLDIDRRQVSPEYGYGFLKKSRCLCNYLEREVLKPLKFRAEGFNRIVIDLSKSPAAGVFVNNSQVACVDILFRSEEYETKHGDALMYYIISRLEEGLRKCSKFVSIPLDELLKGIDDFQAGGMKNEWLYKSRTFRDYGLKASLLCSLAMDEFTLRLQIQRHKAVVFDEVVLQTDPDEIAFAYRFKDLVIEDGSLLITSKLEKPLWKRSLESLP